ncbi:pseudouridine synthase [Haematospirillum sp. H4485]|nr:pseudouridine synthase [Haematospirillum sp. H4890]NKD74768.1 pseudouridine synthase [Haematospirillum sp. H4485]
MADSSSRNEDNAPDHHDDSAEPHSDETGQGPEGERICKFLARAGVCSRRDGERWIADQRVAVNGVVLDTPAFMVTGTDRVTVDGVPVAKADVPRLWRYYKPAGLVTTHHDPQGRATVFENLPGNLPRLISVGRLDLNSEGILLLTNDGELARKLEQPSTGIPRRYRVRVYGAVDENRLADLENGITVEGIHYGPIKAHVERRVGANSWLLITLTEGKNREIRRVMQHLGYHVNRLIRVAYGNFYLGRMERGCIEEVPPRLLREQLASLDPTQSGPTGKPVMDRTGWAKAKVAPTRPGHRKHFHKTNKVDSMPNEQKSRTSFKAEETAPSRARRPHHKDRDHNNENRPRREEGFRPRREDGFRNREDRPRSAGSERPSRDEFRPRREDGFRPRREDGFRNREDRPRSAGSERPSRDEFRPRREDGFRPRREDGFRNREDRPRSAGSERPSRDEFRPRREDGFRPRREDGFRNREDRPRSAGSERPVRDEFRPRREEGFRPRREDGFRNREDRPRSAGSERPARDEFRPRREDGFRNREDRPRSAAGAPRKRYDAS